MFDGVIQCEKESKNLQYHLPHRVQSRLGARPPSVVLRGLWMKKNDLGEERRALPPLSGFPLPSNLSRMPRMICLKSWSYESKSPAGESMTAKMNDVTCHNAVQRNDVIRWTRSSLLTFGCVWYVKNSARVHSNFYYSSLVYVDASSDDKQYILRNNYPKDCLYLTLQTQILRAI